MSAFFVNLPSWFTPFIENNNSDDKERLMTPAIKVAKQSKIIYKTHEYKHDSANKSYGLEAADKLGVAVAQVFKTLVVCTNNKDLLVAIIPVATKLSMKLMAKASGVKKVEMASPIEVERATGYVLGGVSPLGQKKRLKTIIDLSAQNHATIYVSAGRRGLDIELSALDLQTLVNGKFAAITQ